MSFIVQINIGSGDLLKVNKMDTLKFDFVKYFSSNYDPFGETKYLFFILDIE